MANSGVSLWKFVTVVRIVFYFVHEICDSPCEVLEQWIYDAMNAMIGI